MIYQRLTDQAAATCYEDDSLIRCHYLSPLWNCSDGAKRFWFREVQCGAIFLHETEFVTKQAADASQAEEFGLRGNADEYFSPKMN